MREIKFRGKRISDSEWIDGDLVTEVDVDLNVKRAFIHLRLSEVIFFQDGLTARLCLHEVDPKTVGQYTGLKDKNGKEIYEGDTVKFNILMNSGSSEEYLREFVMPVVYEKGCYVVDDWLLCEVECEVIGDIYENPELLEN